MVKLEELRTLKPCLTKILQSINIAVLEKVISILTPFKILRLELCSEKQVTFNLVMLTLKKLMKGLEIDNLKDDSFSKTMKTILISELKKVFIVTNYHKLASFLTPKFRGQFSGDALAQVLAFGNHLIKVNDEFEIREEEEQITIEKPTSSGLFGEFENLENFKVTPSLDEMASYHNENYSLEELTMAPIQFWILKRNKFPKLSPIALHLLITPATSVPSERNFNYAKLTVTDKRCSLEPDKVDDLLFIRSNFDLLDK